MTDSGLPCLDRLFPEWSLHLGIGRLLKIFLCCEWCYNTYDILLAKQSFCISREKNISVSQDMQHFWTFARDDETGIQKVCKLYSPRRPEKTIFKHFIKTCWRPFMGCGETRGREMAPGNSVSRRMRVSRQGQDQIVEYCTGWDLRSTGRIKHELRP